MMKKGHTNIIHVDKGGECYSLEGPKMTVHMIKKKLERKIKNITVDDGPCKCEKKEKKTYAYYHNLTAITC